MADAAPVVTDPAPIVSGTMRRYQIRGRWYQPEEQPDYDIVGLASWYGDQFNGRPTATGERFDMHALTAAHKTLPLPGLVEVTNLANGRRVVLRVNDRGPFVDDRIIDLSRGAAEALDMLSRGVGEVRVRYIGRAPRLGGGTVLQMASAPPPPPPLPAGAPVEAGQRYWIEVAAYRDQPGPVRRGENRSLRPRPGRERPEHVPGPDGAVERCRRRRTGPPVGHGRRIRRRPVDISALNRLRPWPGRSGSPLCAGDPRTFHYA
ncbi:septal ring lytic transglycosylase RlpA family protein [Brevundimonas sp. SL161]|uniref:septal ring lytic transglycosylase RlpA family protein n=1 Tax=Brevundimonas sp. SL161 TaxID=2804613 RepID=UPI003CE998BB